MNNQEAKFILGAYRPNGGDAGDALFADAMSQAERDPELRLWWERQRTFDTVMSRRLLEMQPPAGLRDSILAGGRASQPRRRWWHNPGMLAAAAGIAVLVTIALTFQRGATAPGARDLAAFALRDLADAHDDHTARPPGLESVQGSLVSTSGPLPAALDVDLDELRRKNCRSVRIAGREVFEICFQRDGTWFHLYAAKRADFSIGNSDPQSLITSRGPFASTAWADSKHVYALVTRAGVEALRRAI